jgi:nitrate reductase gamma subunit
MTMVIVSVGLLGAIVAHHSGLQQNEMSGMHHNASAAVMQMCLGAFAAVGAAVVAVALGSFALERRRLVLLPCLDDVALHVRSLQYRAREGPPALPLLCVWRR